MSFNARSRAANLVAHLKKARHASSPRRRSRTTIHDFGPGDLRGSRLARPVVECLELRSLLSAPGAPGIPDLRASDDTGFTGSDNITSETNDLSFFWSAGSGATRYYYGWDDPNPQTLFTTNTGANIDAPAGHGPHTFYVRSWNSSGFSTSRSLGVYIDRKTPILTGLDLRGSDDTGYSNADNITRKTNVRISWVPDDRGGSGIRQYRWGWNPSDLRNVALTNYIDVTPPLNNGQQTLYVVAESLSGLTSEPVQLSILFDTSAPGASVVTSPVGDITTLSPTIRWNYSSGRDWKFDVELEYETAPDTWVSQSGWPQTAVRSDSRVASGLHATTRYRVRVKEYDLAGNVGGFGDWTTFTTSGGGPRVTSFGTEEGSEFGPVDHLIVRFDTSINEATFTPSDVSITRDGTPIGVSSVDRISAIAYRINFPAQTVPGTYQVVIGPNIAATSGALMNQNQVAPNGQDPEDRYVDSFRIVSPFVSGPRVTTLAPPEGSQYGPVSFVVVRFDSAIEAATFTPTDVTLSRDDTPIAVDQVERVSKPRSGSTSRCRRRRDHTASWSGRTSPTRMIDR